ANIPLIHFFIFCSLSLSLAPTPSLGLGATELSRRRVVSPIYHSRDRQVKIDGHHHRSRRELVLLSDPCSCRSVPLPKMIFHAEVFASKCENKEKNMEQNLSLSTTSCLPLPFVKSTTNRKLQIRLRNRLTDQIKCKILRSMGNSPDITFFNLVPIPIHEQSIRTARSGEVDSIELDRPRFRAY
ncbi:hypothetical protein U1Q18_009285, partial [Sarracenia purpurea var. burkii]